MASAEPTRDRILRVAMDLFGRHGYHATSIADIEAAAGLSAGSGALYRHFRSKAQLLAAGVEGQIAASAQLYDRLAAVTVDGTDLRSTLRQVIQAGLDRIEEERDLSRVLMRDLSAFPELMRLVRDRELTVIIAMVSQVLSRMAPGRDADWEALASVAVGAVAHYWLLTDLFGAHPLGPDADRFVDALVDLLAVWLEHPAP